MKGNLIALFSILCFSGSSFCQTESQTDKLNPNDFAQVFQLAIDLPSLQKYFHPETDSSRKQIVFKYFGNENHGQLAGVKKFGRQAIVLSEEEIKKRNIKYYFVVGDWVCGIDVIRLQLSYVGEGVLASYRFIKVKNKWNVDNSHIEEE